MEEQPEVCVLNVTSENIEYLIKLEDEHLRLQRQVRQIQTDRDHRVQGVHPTLRRQDDLLNVLKREYVSLKTDIKIAKSGAHKKNARNMKKYLRRALLEHQKILQQCECGINVIKEFNGLLQRNKKNVLHLRSLVNASQGQALLRKSQLESRLVSMENNLETARLRFNVIQHQNHKLRDEIESLLKDRASFNRDWTRMINILNKGKKFLTDLFESSTVAYDQRDEWVRKLRAITERGKLDQNLQMQEMRDLQKAVDHEAKLHEFLSSKGVMRVNKHCEKKEKKKKLQQETRMKDDIDKHTDYLEQVYEYTSESNLDRIIDHFSLTESECFSIYKLVTDTCAECTVLERELANKKRDIEDRKEWMERKDNEHKQEVEELQRDLRTHQAEVDRLKAIQAGQDNNIEGIMTHVREMFQSLKCSYEPFANLLGDKKPSMWNYKLTFELITEQINYYTQAVYYFERNFHKLTEFSREKSALKKPAQYTVATKQDRPIHRSPMNIVVPANPCPACVESRWMSRMSEDIEVPFDKRRTVEALQQLIEEPAYETSDRLHMLTDCTSPKSRIILAKRYM